MDCEYRTQLLLQSQTESVVSSIALRDLHLGSALVCSNIMQGTQHKIWLPHYVELVADVPI